MNKYRAYDKLEKQMRRVVSLHWQNDTLVAVKVEGEAEPLLIEGRFIVEQYTGIKDKNGVEIAVGDIIECVDKGPEDTEVERDVVSDLTNILDVLYKMGELEVIGNIHENAELLEEYKSGE